jgi:hypothetical protein
MMSMSLGREAFCAVSKEIRGSKSLVLCRDALAPLAEHARNARGLGKLGLDGDDFEAASGFFDPGVGIA